MALLRTNQALTAEPILEALTRESGGARAWHYLGVARHLLRKLQPALDAFRRSIAIDPAFAESYSALAVVLGQTGDWAQAERILVQGLAHLPDDPRLHFNLAVALEHRGADAAALEHYDLALRIRPEYSEASLNRGAQHLRKGRYASALEDFDAILARQPNSVDALVNRSRTLLQMHRDDEALATARAALRVAPGRAEARLSAAMALASIGSLEAARREMAAHDPAWDAAAAYVGLAIQRQEACEWRDRDQLIGTVRSVLDSPERLVSVSDFGSYVHMLSMPFAADELRRVADAVASRVASCEARVPLAASPRHARVRIGFFCEGVGRHPQTYLLRRVASELDRTRFELRLYALNADDGTALRRDFAARADAFTDVSALDSGAIVDLARRDQLDIALDGAGYFQPARPEIFKARVAPIQAAYLASPGPHGRGLVDYRLSDAWTTPPETQSAWTEKLVLLPAPHWTFDNSIVAGPGGLRADHGLPRRGFVFCCMTQAWKLEPESFSVWMRLLRAVEGSVLWLLDSGLANERLRATAAAHGVDPARLVLARRLDLEDHLGRLTHADVFLDTFYYNAQTTAIDALWAGVPLVTRVGTTMASRLASTFVRSAGLDSLVTGSSQAYEAMALRLAREPQLLRQCRERLVAARRTAPVFDTVARVRMFERAIVAMVERHRAGLPPDMLVVE